MSDLKEKLVELLIKGNGACVGTDCFEGCNLYFEADCLYKLMADVLIANGVTIQECARPLEEWHEDYGDALWWKFPIEEPPYVGSPLDMAWPGYHTHWTLIPMPQPPKGE